MPGAPRVLKKTAKSTISNLNISNIIALLLTIAVFLLALIVLAYLRWILY